MTARTIHDEIVVADHPILRQRVLCVLPVIPEDAPYQVREGIARRRIAATTGVCPCGAEADYGPCVPGEVGVGEVAHEDGCPAVTETLIEALKGWLS